MDNSAKTQQQPGLSDSSVTTPTPVGQTTPTPAQDSQQVDQTAVSAAQPVTSTDQHVASETPSTDSSSVKTMATKTVQEPSATINNSPPDPAVATVSQPEPSIVASEDSQAQITAPSAPQISDQKATSAQATLQQQGGSPRSKEHEPSNQPLPDVAKLTEAEIVEEEKVVEAEIEKMVEQSPDREKPDIPKEVQQAGVTHASEDLPVAVSPSSNIKLPMTFEEAYSTKKKYDHKWLYWRKSIAWFAALIMYHWKKIKITTTEVKNKEDL